MVSIASLTELLIELLINGLLSMSCSGNCDKDGFNDPKTVCTTSLYVIIPAGLILFLFVLLYNDDTPNIIFIGPDSELLIHFGLPFPFFSLVIKLDSERVSILRISFP